MPSRYDDFLHTENMKGLRLRLEAEDDPVKRALLARLLEQESAGMLSPPKPGWSAKQR